MVWLLAEFLGSNHHAPWFYDTQVQSRTTDCCLPRRSRGVLGRDDSCFTRTRAVDPRRLPLRLLLSSLCPELRFGKQKQKAPINCNREWPAYLQRIFSFSTSWIMCRDFIFTSEVEFFRIVADNTAYYCTDILALSPFILPFIHTSSFSASFHPSHLPGFTMPMQPPLSTRYGKAGADFLGSAPTFTHSLCRGCVRTPTHPRQTSFRHSWPLLRTSSCTSTQGVPKPFKDTSMAINLRVCVASPTHPRSMKRRISRYA